MTHLMEPYIHYLLTLPNGSQVVPATVLVDQHGWIWWYAPTLPRQEVRHITPLELWAILDPHLDQLRTYRNSETEDWVKPELGHPGLGLVNTTRSLSALLGFFAAPDPQQILVVVRLPRDPSDQLAALTRLHYTDYTHLIRREFGELFQLVVQVAKEIGDG